MAGWFPLTDWISAAYHHNIPTELKIAVANPIITNAQQYAAEGWKRVETLLSATPSKTTCPAHSLPARST